MDELLSEFLTETGEGLDQLDVDLVRFEQEPNNTGMLNAIFRLEDKGLATATELERLSDADVCKFIFKAGFSTAQAISGVSGRGVGMDVVRTNIELIGGTVDLKATSASGTTFTIKIPLTLAIMAALIVETAGRRFAIPQYSRSQCAWLGRRLGRRAGRSGSRSGRAHRNRGRKNGLAPVPCRLRDTQSRYAFAHYAT